MKAHYNPTLFTRNYEDGAFFEDLVALEDFNKDSPIFSFPQKQQPPKPPTVLETLSLAKSGKIRLTHDLFMKLYRYGITDFSNCIFVEVDFSEHQRDTLLLKGAEFCVQNEITPDQFICLFRCRPKYISFEQIRHPCNIELSKEYILEKSPEERGILLFYAVMTNSPTLISLLLAEEADASVQDYSEETAIEYAKNNRRWKCIEAFATQNTNQQDTYHYGVTLLAAAKRHQWDIVKKLIKANADPNDPEDEGLKNDGTALTYCSKCR